MRLESNDTGNQCLCGRIAMLRGTHNLAVQLVLSRLLRSVRQALHPARRLIPCIPNQNTLSRHINAGFTMVELVVVIAVMAILAGFSTGMITGPIFGYMQTDNNLAVVDMADNALRRVTRQVRNALPNSVRVTTNGANSYLEFIPIKTAGRYRAGKSNTNTGDELTVGTADASFDVIGAPVTIAANDRLVIYNLGISGADVYAGDNITNLTATGSLTNLTFTAKNFALGSPNNRFYVVSTAASFACDMANRRLVYYSGYAIPANQPNTIAGLNALATARVVIDNLSSCAIEYSAGVLQRSGVVTIRLGVTQGGAVVNLMHLVNVVNSP